tara:strand:+ start:377 stop:790 length:414 start_codon:yes stop_codon:yes gene_type:complete
LSSNISDKDKKDWDNFLSSRENLPNKDNLIKKNNIKKEFTFDLHGYSLSDANDKVSDLINMCFENGIRKLIVVTGKGLHSKNKKNPYVSKDLGILKYSVPEYIKNNIDLMKNVNDITEADEKDGGSGAFYIFLKKKL